MSRLDFTHIDDLLKQLPSPHLGIIRDLREAHKALKVFSDPSYLGFAAERLVEHTRALRMLSEQLETAAMDIHEKVTAGQVGEHTNENENL